MYTYTPIPYYQGMTVRHFLQAVKDYIEVTEEDAQIRKEAYRRRR